ncbi:MAG: protoheme IX farnesyltransferase [Flavobacteriales bacterium]|nr:protoheme IX farnesyltransferase [Flavobacteriales bacterium]
MNKINLFFQLTKFRLTLTVVFSAIAGYLLGLNDFSLNSQVDLLLLVIGGFCVTGSANAFNQILERDYDRMMKRTSNRPLAMKKISVLHSVFFASILSILGIFLLFIINPYCSLFGSISILIYVLFYTPLKRFSSFSIFVGAIPGALPFLIGWVAAYDYSLLNSSIPSGFELDSGALFAMQFFWQFPHFIAIAWVQDKDYKQAGFKMMIGEKKGNVAAFSAIVSTILLIVCSISPYMYEMNKLDMSYYTLLLVLLLGAWFLYFSIKLLVDHEDSSARKLMFSSFIYLPLLQTILILDKYFLNTSL